MKKVGIIKRIFALLLVFLLSINSFAAVVSDNDGSAFITKAEFDSLKNNFQAQIDSYNQSIDSKIDGAIASYLAGIKLSNVIEETSLINACGIIGFRRNWNNFGVATGYGDAYNYATYFTSYAGAGCTDSGNTLITRAGTSNTYPVNAGVGSTPDNFLVLQSSIFDESDYCPQTLLTSTPFVASFISGSLNGAKYTGSMSTSAPLDFEYEQDASDGSVGASFGKTIWTTAQSRCSQNIDLGVLDVWTLKDVLYSSSSINMTDIASGTVPTTDAHVIYADDLDSIVAMTTQEGLLSKQAYLYDTAAKTKYTISNSKLNYSLKLKVKRHKNALVRYDTIMNEKISTVAGEKIYYYNGLPLFKASNTGRVKMSITPKKIAGSSTSVDVAIGKGKFGNTYFSAGISVPNAMSNITSWVAWPLDSPQTVEFNVEQGNIYWIKAQPSATGLKDSVYFVTDSIELTVAS